MKVNTFKKFVGAAFAVGVLAGNAFSQLEDANIPFVVNVDATVIISRGNNEITMEVEGGVEKTFTISAETLPVRHGAASRQTNVAHVRTDARGNVNLRLPQTGYQNAQISLHTLNGRRVMHKSINAATTNVSRTNVAPGVYVLTARGVDGNSFTSRLNHRGGVMNVNVSYGAVTSSNLRRETAFLSSADEWTVRVTADEYLDSVYTLAINSGDNIPLQTITLQTPFNSEITYGSFTDSRDGKTYRTVTIGTQTWMARNLNYATESGSWCYDDNVYNCNVYGRLYNWSTAMGLASSYNTSNFTASGNHQGVCPDGWHMPTDAEWTELVNAVGDNPGAGTKLKSTTGWNAMYFSDERYDIPGTNDFGFSALPGGFYDRRDNLNLMFGNIGNGGYWWSATQSDAGNAWLRYIINDVENFSRINNRKVMGYSVRCVKD